MPKRSTARAAAPWSWTSAPPRPPGPPGPPGPPARPVTAPPSTETSRVTAPTCGRPVGTPIPSGATGPAGGRGPPGAGTRPTTRCCGIPPPPPSPPVRAASVWRWPATCWAPRWPWSSSCSSPPPGVRADGSRSCPPARPVCGPVSSGLASTSAAGAAPAHCRRTSGWAFARSTWPSASPVRWWRACSPASRSSRSPSPCATPGSPIGTSWGASPTACSAGPCSSSSPASAHRSSRSCSSAGSSRCA